MFGDVSLLKKKVYTVENILEMTVKLLFLLNIITDTT